MKLFKLLFLLLLLPSVVIANAPADTAKARKGIPIMLNSDTLFHVQNRLGSLSAAERATRTSAILARLEGNMLLIADSIKVMEEEATSDIIYGKEIIFSVANIDADSAKINRQALAKIYRFRMVDSIKNYKAQTDITELLLRTGQGLLILLVLAIAIFFLNKYSNRILNVATLRLSKHLKGVRIRNYELLTKAGEIVLFRKAFHIFKYVFIAFLVYITLPFIFRLFPWTKSWSDTLIDFVLSPLRNMLSSVVQFIPNLITIVIVVVVFKYINRLIKFLASEIEAGKLKISGFYADWAKPTYNIIRFILYAFMLVVIWPFLPGSNSEIFKGISVFLGLLISLGSSTAIGNIVAGLVITYMRPFRIGDRVRIGDVTGDIVEKAFLVTRLKTIKNEVVTIPNAAILNGNTTNYSLMAQEDGLIVHTTVTIGYETPWPQIHQLLIDAAMRCEGILKDRKPFVLQTSLDDWYVSYQLNAYTNSPNSMAQIYSNLHQEIQNVFFENGVEIMSPHYQAMRDGNETSIPPSYRAQDYEAPSFNIKSK